MLHINEIFLSVQGEGLKTGAPTIFIRTQGCTLACRYCDTKYAQQVTTDCQVIKVSECVKLVEGYKHLSRDVCLTGGEPLEQNLWDIRNLLTELTQLKYHTTVETGGHKSTEFFIKFIEENFCEVEHRVDFCVDYKLPSSGMIGRMVDDAFSFLRFNDSVKYVVGNGDDWSAAKQHLVKLREEGIKATALFSPVWGAPMNVQELAKKVLAIKTNLHPIRLSLQIHKVIWGPDERGV